MRTWLVVLVSTMCLAVLGARLVQAGGPEDGLEGYWTFDNGDNADDLTGNGHDGELVAGAKLSDDEGPPVRGAKKGIAEFRKRAGDMIDCGPGPQLEDALSLMAWANPDDTGPTQFIAGTPYDDGGAWDAPWVGYQIGIRNGRMATWINLEAIDAEFDSGAAVAGQWHHYCVTFDGNAAITYIDGEEIADSARNGSIEFDGDPHFVIGDRSLTAAGEPFGGLVDEVVLYNRELDPKEIRAVMDGGIELAVRPDGNIVSTWAFLKTAR